MPRFPIKIPSANLLLAALTRKEYGQLQPHLEPFTLVFGEILYEPGEFIRHVYFPENGVISILSKVEERSSLEVGVVGNEGMLGVSVFLGAKGSLNQALVQGEGSAVRMKVGAFLKHLRSSQSPGAMPALLLRYTHSLLTQISQSAACNRFHTVNARLARWLLMTNDRVQSDEFRLTQNFLSHMLGVRREGVTAAASVLQKKKLIRYVRGQIRILDRKGLEAAACKCYGIAVTTHTQLMNREL